MFGRLYKVIGKFIPLIVVTIFNLHAQSYIITGKVSTSTEPVKYASVTFINIADSTQRFTAVTDSSGNYRLDIITSIRDNKNTIPTKFELAQNYPNPFSSSTSITYKLNKQSDISVKIYNILGQIVKEYNVGTQTTGVHGIVWDGRNEFGNRVAPGAYFYQLKSGNDSVVRKMMFEDSGNDIITPSQSNSFFSAFKIKKNSTKLIGNGKYTVHIRSIDSTEPKISNILINELSLQNDTALNFNVIKTKLIANTGSDKVIKVGNYVVLNASASGNDNNDTLIFNWQSLENNPSYVYIDKNALSQRIITPIAGTYKFILVVSTATEISEADTITVVINSRESNPLFEDPMLELSIRCSLNLPTVDITQNDLLNVDSLINPGKYIYKILTLAGIEKCINIKTLYLSGENISNILLLSSLTKLEKLYLDQNWNITDITPLSGLTELQILNVQGNKVTDITPLKNLTKLTSLNLMENPLTDISALNNMKELKELWLSHAEISGTLVISGLTKLKALWITDCKLSDINFLSTLYNLQMLNLDGNQITDISPLENCTKLEVLYMTQNKIRDITPLENLTNLYSLEIMLNQITNIQPLVNNTGFGKGAVIALTRNPLDDISINKYIPELQSRGVLVLW